MLYKDFRRVLQTFADNPTDIDFSKGHMVVQVRDELIEIGLTTRDGVLYVNEGGTEQTAQRWLVRRIARLDMLAERILNYVEPEKHFVRPSGLLLDEIERDPDDEPDQVEDSIAAAQSVLERRPAGTTTVLYLTSDAGEGKTTLINQLSTSQARRFKERVSDWLLVPVPLGGRNITRFDDVVIVALVNRLRFPHLYYESFVELVRLGVLIPAFDGFEEMFVETGSGEALSALGNLVRTLDSAGTVLIAARKAYFEYRNLSARARLLDSIQTDSVSFSRLALQRWTRAQFLEYATSRGLDNGEEIYSRVAERLSEGHPMLSRAVLIRRLIDIACNGGLDDLLRHLGAAPQDYFYQFVNAIIEREATEKWIDRSGTPYRPLLTLEEHHELLASVAQEMWLSNADSLRGDVLELVAEVFAEEHGKSPTITRQIKERLPQHSLISAVEGRQTLFSFDHEDFRKFYLGDALGRTLARRRANEVRGFLEVGSLSNETCDAATQLLTRTGEDPLEISRLVSRLSGADVPTSFTRENCGALIIRLIDGKGEELTIEKCVFPADSLVGRSIMKVRFADCYFQQTSLADARLVSCEFLRCRIDRLDLDHTMHVESVKLNDTNVISASVAGVDRPAFDPSSIRQILSRNGFTSVIQDERAPPAEPAVEFDDDLLLTDKVIRLFWRATQLNEATFRQRLGVKAGRFLDDLLPILARVGLFEDVPYAGAGKQRRFRLGLSMEDISSAIDASNGRFDMFVEVLVAQSANSA